VQKVKIILFACPFFSLKIYGATDLATITTAASKLDLTDQGYILFLPL